MNESWKRILFIKYFNGQFLFFLYFEFFWENALNDLQVSTLYNNDIFLDLYLIGVDLFLTVKCLAINDVLQSKRAAGCIFPILDCGESWHSRNRNASLEPRWADSLPCFNLASRWPLWSKAYRWPWTFRLMRSHVFQSSAALFFLFCQILIILCSLFFLLRCLMKENIFM